MGNAKNFASIVRRFVDGRESAENEYSAAVEKVRGYEGSERHSEEIKKAAQARDEKIGALKAAAAADLDKVFRSMREVIANAPMKPPTSEQLATLQLLKEKQEAGVLLESDMNRAAVTFSGNGDLMAIVYAMAQENGFIVHRRGDGEMDAATAGAAVDGLARSAGRLLNGEQVYSTNIQPAAAATEIIARMAGFPNVARTTSSGVQDIAFDEVAVKAFSDAVG